MHLWPSLRIRDSFKSSYLKNLDWNLHRMNREKESQSNQKLLEHENDLVGKVGDCDSKISGVFVLFKELLMLFSCCYCCFCCGACVEEEEN